MQERAPRKFVFLDAGTRIGRMSDMVTDLVEERARKTCKDKIQTVRHLLEAGVPTTDQRIFGRDEFEAALEYATASNFDVVIKPSTGAGGRGVTTFVCGPESFTLAWTSAGREEAGRDVERILVEKKVKGIDVRAVVVAGAFVCATSRIPANVVGDGKSSITELVHRKNKLRERNPYHKRYGIKLSDATRSELKRQSLTVDDVLPVGIPCLLAGPANIHFGGDAVDVTNLIPASAKRLAEAASRAVPGLGVAGVDLLLDGLGEEASAVVIEINTAANFGMHYFPLFGAPRNPAEAVVRAMKARAVRASAGITLHEGILPTVPS